jgi:hypothetical protein
MQNVEEPFPFIVSVQGMRYRILNGALSHIFLIVDQNKSFSDMSYMSVGNHVTKIAEVEAEVACHVKYHVAQAFFFSIANRGTAYDT